MIQIRISDIKRKKTLLSYLSKKKINSRAKAAAGYGQTEIVILLKKKKKYEIIKGGLTVEITKKIGKDYVWCRVFKNISNKKLQKVLQN